MKRGGSRVFCRTCGAKCLTPARWRRHYVRKHAN